MRVFILIMGIVFSRQVFAQNVKELHTSIFVNGLNGRSVARVEFDLQVTYNIADQIKKITGVVQLDQMILYDVELGQGFKEDLIIESPIHCYAVQNTVSVLKNEMHSVAVAFDCYNLMYQYPEDITVKIDLNNDLTGIVKIIYYGEVLMAMLNWVQ